MTQHECYSFKHEGKTIEDTPLEDSLSDCKKKKEKKEKNRTIMTVFEHSA